VTNSLVESGTYEQEHEDCEQQLFKGSQKDFSADQYSELGLLASDRYDSNYAPH